MKPYTFILIYLMSIGAVFAQNGTIEGTVTNSKNNQPVPFANIIIMGTTTGTSSDIDGNFSFKDIKPGYVRVVVSSIGFDQYSSQEFFVSGTRPAHIEIPLNEKAVNLSAIEVHTTAFEKKEESPVSMNTLGIQEIEKNPGGNRDISKVIQSLPGVASTVSYRNDVIVRGGGASENRFYLDDVEIPNLNHFATQGASGGPAGIINVDFIRTVDFYSGAFPADKGNALSSIVDMKQLDGNKDKLNVKLTLGASDYGLSLDGPLGKKSTFFLSARRSYLKLLFSLLKLPFLPTYNDFQFKNKIVFDKKHQLTIIGLGAIDNNKLNLSADETDAQRYILSYLPVNDQWNYVLGIVYRQFRENSYDTYVLTRNMLSNSIYKYKDNDDSNPGNLLQDYKSSEIENKFRYENTTRVNNFKINAGAGIEYDKYLNKTYQRLFYGGTEQVLDYESFLELYKWSIFGQVSKGVFGERLNLSLGLRADGNNYNSRMANPLMQLSPRFSAGWSFNEKWSLNFNIGRYYQLPPYTTLGFRNTNGELVNRQNDLRYISSDHLVLGFGYQDNRNIQLTLEGFYKYYQHYPFSVTDSICLASKSGDFTTYGDEEVTSTSNGRAYGAEFLFRIKMLKGFNLLLSYTFVRSEFTGKTSRYIPSAWDNRHLANLTFSKNFKYNWYVGLKWRFLGGAPYTPYDLGQSRLISAWNVRGRTYLDYSQYNSLRLKPYHQLDVRVDKEFYWKKWSLNIYADIQNIYNNKAAGPDNYILATDEQGQRLTDPADPSRYILKPIPNESGTIVPTIGIIIEF